MHQRTMENLLPEELWWQDGVVGLCLELHCSAQSGKAPWGPPLQEAGHSLQCDIVAKGYTLASYLHVLTCVCTHRHQGWQACHTMYSPAVRTLRYDPQHILCRHHRQRKRCWGAVYGGDDQRRSSGSARLSRCCVQCREAFPGRHGTWLEQQREGLDKVVWPLDVLNDFAGYDDVVA